MLRKLLALGFIAAIVGAMVGSAATLGVGGGTIQTWIDGAELSADNLIVDKDNARLVGSLYGPHTRLHGIKLENNGEYGITIDRFTIGWNSADGENIRLVNIWFWGEIEWTGEEPSGAELDIEDFTLSPGEDRHIDFTFDQNMEGKIFTIDFIMGDGSILQVSEANPLLPIGRG